MPVDKKDLITGCHSSRVERPGEGRGAKKEREEEPTPILGFSFFSFSFFGESEIINPFYLPLLTFYSHYQPWAYLTFFLTIDRSLLVNEIFFFLCSNYLSLLRASVRMMMMMIISS